MIIQLNPFIPVQTPKGKAIAHFLIDYGIESSIHWVCFQDDTGECWTWRNEDIRAQKNITVGRENISDSPNNYFHYLNLRCPQCDLTDVVCDKYAKDWKCPRCNPKNISGNTK